MIYTLKVDGSFRYRRFVHCADCNQGYITYEVIGLTMSHPWWFEQYPFLSFQ
jgi:hypothetical protein